MKNKVLVISLLALSGALIGSDTPTPQYRFSGKEAVDCLIRNGNSFDCDLSNQDLRAAIAAYNLRNRKRFMFINLSDGNLSGANLSGTDLSCATMRGANLSGANLNDAIMTDANLSGANLTNASMSCAIMHNVNMTDANMTGANLHYASMHNVNMTGANITGADMSDAKYLYTVIGYTSTK